MYDDMINGISRALDYYFNGVEIISEHEEQGFTEPCFFISLLQEDTKFLLGNRYRKNYLFNIRYHPTMVKKYDELMHIAETVLDSVEMIEAGDILVQASTFEVVVKDGVLHCNILYKVDAYRPKKEVDKMESLDTKVGLS